MKTTILVITMFYTVTLAVGQIGQLESNLISDNNLLHSTGGFNKDKDDENFSYSKYSSFNLDEFAEVFPFKNVDNYTLFLVFKQKKEGRIAKVSSNNHSIEIGDSYINTKINRPLSLETNVPHILMYKGSNGKPMRDKVLNGEFRFSKTKDSKISDNFDSELLVADIISYNRILTNKEIKIQESALALKYGISLPRDSSYCDSKGMVLFDGRNETYNYRVSAIGFDDGYNFNKKISKNTDSNTILTVQSNSVESNLNGFIFYADNGLKVEFEDNVLHRKWRMTNEFADKLNLKFSFQLLDSEVDNSKFNYFLIICDSPYCVEGVEYPLKVEEDKFTAKFQGDVNQKYLVVKRKLISKSISNTVSLSFPTPTNHIEDLTIEIISEKNISGFLHVLDSKGSTLYNTKVFINERSPYTVKTRFTHPGIYFAKFSNEEVLITKKIITY